MLLLTDSDSNARVSDFAHLLVLAVPWNIIHHGQDEFAVHRSDPSHLPCPSVCEDLQWSRKNYIFLVHTQKVGNILCPLEHMCGHYSHDSGFIIPLVKM